MESIPHDNSEIPSNEKPSSVPIHPDGIPSELRERPQWVAWGWEQKEDRWTKVPVNPLTGRRASSTDPSSWSSFDETYAFAQREGLAGIGFVVTPNDPFVGIDLDHCRNPQTGEIDFWAQEIINRFASYTEVTPSGTGVRIWITTRDGLLPGREKGRRKGPIEIYARDRYFTVTGQPHV
jgi:putative DNA primase/helicase